MKIDVFRLQSNIYIQIHSIVILDMSHYGHIVGMKNNTTVKHSNR
jgi:hypothetical protein